MSKLIPMIAANRDQLSQIHADKNRWNKFLDNMAAKIRAQKRGKPRSEIAAAAARRMEDRDEALYQRIYGEDPNKKPTPAEAALEAEYARFYPKEA